MSDQIVYIYVLCCPETDEPKYIGKTVKLKKRLQSHIREAKAGKKTAKCKWIRELLQKNKMPVMKVIDEVCNKDWKAAEKHYIQEYKKLNANLTNIADGGEGFELGYKQDQWFQLKKYFGKKYNEAVKQNNKDMVVRIAKTIVQLCKYQPHRMPKRWLSIKIP